jgi:hypothetical protein
MSRLRCDTVVPGLRQFRLIASLVSVGDDGGRTEWPCEQLLEGVMQCLLSRLPRSLGIQARQGGRPTADDPVFGVIGAATDKERSLSREMNRQELGGFGVHIEHALPLSRFHEDVPIIRPIQRHNSFPGGPAKDLDVQTAGTLARRSNEKVGAKPRIGDAGVCGIQKGAELGIADAAIPVHVCGAA